MEKPKPSNTKTIINVVLILLLLWIIFMPAISASVMSARFDLFKLLKGTLRAFAPLIGLFLLNYLFLCPKCLFAEGKKKWFYIANLALILGWRAVAIIKSLHDGIPPEVMIAFGDANMTPAMLFGNFIIVLFDVIIVALAVGICNIIRSADLTYKYEAQKRKAAEAELSWLKNQLNPHFLFNTLNNISSLTLTDGEKAQDSIAQLSNLLRYVLYESNKEFVPLSSEVSFMRDYIDLMKLRYDGKTSVSVVMGLPSGNAEIAPLLFISLIENAFKHGASSRSESFVDISMKADGEDLLFVCTNSLLEKPKTDLAGSGIGLQNMSKRLELIYPGRYEFNYGPDGDRYIAELRIKEMFN